MKNELDSEDLNLWFMSLSLEEKQEILENYIQKNSIKEFNEREHRKYDTAETVNKLGRALAKELYN